MRQWRTIALDRDGRTLHARIAAPDEAAVARLLRRSGAVPLEIKADRQGVFGFAVGDALSRAELSLVLRELATMLGAGQDLDHALQFLQQTAPRSRVRRVMAQVHEEIRNGASLAAAMAMQPRSFSRLVIGMVRGGEAGGALAVTLDRLAALTEAQQALATTIQSALIYPALLVVAAIGAISLLLVQVLRQFVPLFEQNGAALPASTRFLLDAGEMVGRIWPWALLGVLAVLMACRLALRRPGIRLAVDRLVLRLPLIGYLQREILAARLCRSLGTLLQNGVSLVPTLAIVREVLGNAAAMQALDRATEAARDGAGLSGALAASGIFPERTVHLLRLGEETAKLASVALRAAEIHEEAARVTTQRLTALLTPAITIVMGAVIAGIVSSLLLAMLSLNDLAQ